MSEASRQRWLFIHNRLEELFAKHGPPPDVEVPERLDHIDADPSWGPVGSLVLQLLGAAEYTRLRDIDAEIRSRPARRPVPAEPSSEPPAQSSPVEAPERPPATPLNRP